MTAIDTTQQPLLTADGTPLTVSLQKSLRRNKIRAVGLVSLPFLFLLFVFIIPIGDLLLRSIDDQLINEVLPRTFAQYETWDRESLPDVRGPIPRRHDRRKIEARPKHHAHELREVGMAEPDEEIVA